MPEAFPCLIKRESAAIFLGVSCAVSVPLERPCGGFVCVFTCRRGRGRGEEVGSWGCGGHLGVWWGGARLGGSCVRAACIFRARAMRTGPAPTRSCAGVSGTQEC